MLYYLFSSPHLSDLWSDLERSGVVFQALTTDLKYERGKEHEVREAREV